MTDIQDWTAFEKVGLPFDLFLMVIGITETTELIDIIPVYVYIVILWFLTVAIWIHKNGCLKCIVCDVR
jgi:hypothetical protein